MMEKIVAHLVDTLRYRFDHAISNANENYYNLSLENSVRTPLEILYHMRGLMYYAIKVYTNERTPMGEMTTWNEECSLFYESMDQLRQLIKDEEVSREEYFKMVQGPIADALTHVGQLAMISRINNRPIEKQNFYRAEIGTAD